MTTFWWENVHIQEADRSPFVVYVHEEDGGYVLRWGTGSYISGPHPSKEYANLQARWLTAREGL